MPVFRCNDRLHYFAHVPKCGGQSVEAYLARRFGALGFIDNDYFNRDRSHYWPKSSPQHVTVRDFGLLLPWEWIDTSFAVVRHPVSRLVSAYNFRSVRSAVPVGMGIEEWFEENLSIQERLPFHDDNHLRRQSDLVPEGAALFRLEDGLEPVVAYLDQLAGTTAPELGGFEVHNKTRKTDKADLEPQPITEAFARVVERHYAEDYDRFGYQTGQVPSGLAAQVPVRMTKDGVDVSPARSRLSLMKRRLQRRLLGPGSLSAGGS